MKVTSLRGLALVVLVLVMLFTFGCANQKPTAPSPNLAALTEAENSAELNAHTAGRLATALQDAVLTQSFTYEPSGDIELGAGGSSRFYAVINAVRTEPTTVTFDIAQLYLGDDAVEIDPDIPNPGLTIDEHQHSQTVPASDDTVVVLQATHKQEADTLYGSVDGGAITTVSFEEFTRRFADDSKSYGEISGYVITIDRSGVSSIVEVYFP